MNRIAHFKQCTCNQWFYSIKRPQETYRKLMNVNFQMKCVICEIELKIIKRKKLFLLGGGWENG